MSSSIMSNSSSKLIRDEQSVARLSAGQSIACVNQRSLITLIRNLEERSGDWKEEQRFKRQQSNHRVNNLS